MTSSGRAGQTAIKRPGSGIPVDRGRLTRLRQARLLSRAQLADAMSDPEPRDEGSYSITPDAIAKIENGHRRPKTATLARMCKALGCTPADLLLPEEAGGLVQCAHCQGLFGHDSGCRNAT